MNQITLLAELQNVDAKSDENAVVRARLTAELADGTALDAARAELAAGQKRAADLEAALRELELETGGLAEHLKQVNERLYSGRITNAKELAGLNQDEKMLQRRKSELEDRELVLMEQIEAAQNAAQDKRAAFEKILAGTQTRNDRERTALHDLDVSDAQLANKRSTLRAQLPVETLRIYDDLRQSKKGRAVAMMKDNSCSKCGNQVPSGLVARVKAGNELVFCTNCERILAP